MFIYYSNVTNRIKRLYIRVLNVLWFEDVTLVYNVNKSSIKNTASLKLANGFNKPFIFVLINRM